MVKTIEDVRVERDQLQAITGFDISAHNLLHLADWQAKRRAFPTPNGVREAKNAQWIGNRL